MNQYQACRHVGVKLTPTLSVLFLLGDITRNQTFMTPSGLFLIIMTLLYRTVPDLWGAVFPLYNSGYEQCLMRDTWEWWQSVAMSAIKRQVIHSACCKCCCWNNSDATIVIEPSTNPEYCKTTVKVASKKFLIIALSSISYYKIIINQI